MGIDCEKRRGAQGRGSGEAGEEAGRGERVQRSSWELGCPDLGSPAEDRESTGGTAAEHGETVDAIQIAGGDGCL